MQADRIAFRCKEDVGRFMGELFGLYLSYKSVDSFAFEWLQKTEEIEVRCEDATGEKVVFSTPPNLLKAIHNCERVTAPEKRLGLPSDWGFSGFMDTAAHQVLKQAPLAQAQEFEGPVFRWLGLGIIRDTSVLITGVQVFRLSCNHYNHWSCIIQDQTYPFDAKQKETGRDYFLKSEILAVTSIFFRQTNKMVWLPEKGWFRPEPIYKEGSLTATVVTFTPGKVRVVQATCNPSEKCPTLTLRLRAIYSLGKATYSQEVAFEILKWLLSPPEPAKEFAMRSRK